MLAARRLSEAKLRERLTKKAFDPSDIDDAIERARRDGYIDDSLYATLYVETRSRALGNRRIVGDLVRRGIPHEEAKQALQDSEIDEETRLAQAYEKLKRTRSTLSLPAAARALERLGFPTPAIYRHLQTQAQEFFAPPPDLE
jgi:SOS response regulatory protein OraA/RecX